MAKDANQGGGLPPGDTPVHHVVRDMAWLDAEVRNIINDIKAAHHDEEEAMLAYFDRVLGLLSEVEK